MTRAVSAAASPHSSDATQAISTNFVTDSKPANIQDQFCDSNEMTRSSSLRQESTPQPANSRNAVQNTSVPAAKRADSASDNETSERPVREKLKKTSIATLPKYGVAPAADVEGYDGETLRDEIFTKPKDEGQDKENSESRGRPARKRSFDDLEAEDVGERGKDTEDKQTSAESYGKHVRKRSRDLKPGEALESLERRKRSEESLREEGEERQDRQMSDLENIETRKTSVQPQDHEPMDEDAKVRASGIKKKRSRDQFDKDLEKEVLDANAEDDKVHRSSEDSQRSIGQSGRRSTRDQPETKRHRDTSLEAARQAEKPEETQIPPTSGFANTSAVSPFGTLAETKSPTRNSASVFKPTTSSKSASSSGFAGLSSSSTSPFGALGAASGAKSPFGTLSDSGKSPLSGFGTLGAEKSDHAFSAGFGGGSPAPSLGFGTAGASGFGNSGSSGFGKIGAGFGGGGGSGGLTSFAAKGGSGIIGLSEKPAKPFGAPAAGEDDEESGSDGDDDAEEDHDDQEEKEDKRFQQQELETGEEGEITIISCRAKLFANSGKEWKERGQGTFKLNVTEGPEDDSEPSKTSARLLMRADGSHRVVLNTPIFKSMKIGGREGEAPTGGSILFTGIEDGKPVPLLLKVKQGNAADLYDQVQDLQKQM